MATISPTKNLKPFPKLAIVDFAILTLCFSLLFLFHSLVASKTPTDGPRHPELLNHLGVVYAAQYGFAIAALIIMIRHRIWTKTEITAGIYLAITCGLVAALEIVSQVWAFQVNQQPHETSAGMYIAKLGVPLFCFFALSLAIKRFPLTWKLAFSVLCIYFLISTIRGIYLIYSTEAFMAPYLRYYQLLTMISKIALLLVFLTLFIAAALDIIRNRKTTWMHHFGWLLMLNLIVICPALEWLTGRFLWPE